MVRSDKNKKKVNGNADAVREDGNSCSASGPASRSSGYVAEKMKEHQKNFANATKDAFEAISKHAKETKVDHKAIMESHQKNLSVLNEANKKMAEVMKSIATLQSQFAKQTFEDFNTMMRSAMTHKVGQPVDIDAHTEVMKNSFQRALDHAQQVSGVLSKSGKDIHESMKTRMEEGKEELKAHMEKHQHTRH